MSVCDLPSTTPFRTNSPYGRSAGTWTGTSCRTRTRAVTRPPPRRRPSLCGRQRGIQGRRTLPGRTCKSSGCSRPGRVARRPDQGGRSR